MSVAEVFSTHSHIYATAENERFYTRIAAALAEKVSSRLAPGKILEVGAGTGAATIILKRYFPKAEILATDPSREMLAHNRQKGLEGVRHACLRAEDASRLDEKYDLIFGNICYHWFKPGTARELSRLLTPAGVLAFSTPTSGQEKGDGNLIMFRICRELGVKGRHGRHLSSLSRLRKEFAHLKNVATETITLRETYPPAFHGTLMRARGSWTFIFGTEAGNAENLWRKYTTGRALTTLYWHITLVVAGL
ncbi:MAG: methyltransferase domain-containing protein [Ammonifex sp.]|jgi:trans-aconitate methyltransferase|nr:MAG: methyltransferase domain-containing protein [Ammonifex sp.]